MQAFITPGSPTLVISYNHLHQSIDAQFSMPNSQNITPIEQETIDLITKDVERAARQFIHQLINSRTLVAFEITCQQILKAAEYQTGVKFQLDARYLTL